MTRHFDTKQHFMRIIVYPSTDASILYYIIYYVIITYTARQRQSNNNFVYAQRFAAGTRSTLYNIPRWYSITQHDGGGVIKRNLRRVVDDRNVHIGSEQTTRPKRPLRPTATVPANLVKYIYLPRTPLRY